MKKYLPILFSVFILLASCKKKNEAPAVNGDDITVSTEFFGTNYYVYGYSFEYGKAISSLDANQVADVIPTRVQKPDGSVLGAELTAGRNNPYGFQKMGAFSTLQQATDYYNSLHEVTGSNWESLSDTLAPFQVYTFKTFRENYVKFLVTGVNIISGATPQDAYVNIDLTFYIQRDGSTTFDE